MAKWFILLSNYLVCFGSGVGAGYGIWVASNELWATVVIGILVSLGVTMFYGAIIGMVRHYKGYL